MKRKGRVTLPHPLRIYGCFVHLPKMLGIVHSFHVLRWYANGTFEDGSGGWRAIS